MTDWKALIAATQPADAEADELSFGDPATPEQLAEVESALKISLPAELKEVLQLYNGVQDAMGWQVYSTDEMIAWNQETRENYADWDLEHPIENVVLFNDVYGTGDLFGVCVEAFADFKAGQVVMFDHETGSFNADAAEAAESLAAFFAKCAAKD